MGVRKQSAQSRAEQSRSERQERVVTEEEKVKCHGLKQPFCFSAGTI